MEPPKSVIIIGGGVFGLGIAMALATRPAYANTTITLIDRAPTLPASDAASNDASRIVRADYADPAYARLCAEAMVHWRNQSDTGIGGNGRYTQSGMILLANDNPQRDAARAASAKARGLDKWKSAKEYVNDSYHNVCALERSAGRDPARVIKQLHTRNQVATEIGCFGHAGDMGYYNELAGWADAGAATKWMYDRVRATGRVTFLSDTVHSLLRDDADARVLGAKLDSGKEVRADLVVVAAGAWSGKLVDLSGRATATGQILAYVELTQHEFDQIRTTPVVLNLSNGLFTVPPATRLLKLARHAYGYLNPMPAPNALPVTPGARVPPTASLPRTSFDDARLEIPLEGANDLRQLLTNVIALNSLHGRPFVKTRLCWYSDTPTGDFLIDYHPGWKGLFVATGDSGHGFKFLPVLGEKIVDCISGCVDEELKKRWRWREAVSGGEIVATEDGSRAGLPGLLLDEELRRVKLTSRESG
ncbi:hypothetical protein TD95_004758 [Thielaviopsis punctulata]|uniref:FAD dependent oxidoreductase domain-containing protein n=1 Tax=Thielaviopsis punctulata TaxID=72032 RepID=A0A0F4ZDQ5_9PEZI|nr:hypothetical protein TD95_004758 [Thielaviopsis punctulata]